MTDFGQGDWEDSIAKMGKVVEAMLKAVATHCHVTFPTGRKFRADTVINLLGALAPGSHDDSLRLLIPRACRVIYDIASNRGARHDPDEVDSNSMDANVVVPIASWILAEAVRYAQKGVDPSEAKELVESLVERKFPAVKDVDGRIYVHAKNKSAADVGLVVLARQHPQRIARGDLVEAIRRNGFTLNNASVAVTRLARLTDDDGTGHSASSALKRLSPLP